MKNCKDWLEKYLRAEPMVLCEEVRKDSKKKGFTKRELKRARIELGVKTFHQFDEFGDTGNHFWYLED